MRCRLLLFEFIIKLVCTIKVHRVKAFTCFAVLLSNFRHLCGDAGALLGKLGLVGEVNCSERLWIELRLGEIMIVSMRRILMLVNGGRAYNNTIMNDQVGNINFPPNKCVVVQGSKVHVPKGSFGHVNIQRVLFALLFFSGFALFVYSNKYALNLFYSASRHIFLDMSLL
jgi:hypothetical protein